MSTQQCPESFCGTSVNKGAQSPDLFPHGSTSEVIVRLPPAPTSVVRSLLNIQDAHLLKPLRSLHAPCEPQHPDPGPGTEGWNSGQSLLSTLVNSTSSHLGPSPLATEVPLTPDTATQHVRAQASPRGQKGARCGLDL